MQAIPTSNFDYNITIFFYLEIVFFQTLLHIYFWSDDTATLGAKIVIAALLLHALESWE